MAPCRQDNSRCPGASSCFAGASAPVGLWRPVSARIRSCLAYPWVTIRFCGFFDKMADPRTCQRTALDFAPFSRSDSWGCANPRRHTRCALHRLERLLAHLLRSFNRGRHTRCDQCRLELAVPLGPDAAELRRHTRCDQRRLEQKAPLARETHTVFDIPDALSVDWKGVGYARYGSRTPTRHFRCALHRLEPTALVHMGSGKLRSTYPTRSASIGSVDVPWMHCCTMRHTRCTLHCIDWNDARPMRSAMRSRNIAELERDRLERWPSRSRSRSQKEGYLQNVVETSVQRSALGQIDQGWNVRAVLDVLRPSAGWNGCLSWKGLHP